MMYEEFLARVNKHVPIDEYMFWVEPRYMESDLDKDTFCRLFNEGAFKVQFPIDAEQIAYSSALDWGMPWRNVRDTIRIITKIANMARGRLKNTLYGLAYEINDDRRNVSNRQLTGVQAGRDLYTSILDDLSSWGGTIYYGKESVTWECPHPSVKRTLAEDLADDQDAACMSFGR